MSKEVGTGGRFDIFLDSVINYAVPYIKQFEFFMALVIVYWHDFALLRAKRTEKFQHQESKLEIPASFTLFYEMRP